MAFEALTGRPPHVESSLAALAADRLGRPAPAVKAWAPDVSDELAALVDRTLQRSPDLRPSSADECLIALGSTVVVLPFLGSTSAIDALVQAAVEGRSLDVGGPPGSGRTRVLGEVTRRLLGLGRDVVKLSPGARPLESLRVILGDAWAPTTPLNGAEVQVTRFLEGGGVIVADDPERLDRWTRGVLEHGRGSGTVLRAAAESGEGVQLRPLDEAALRALFHGPDRVLHLREDAGRLLAQRTGGSPARVAAEVASWVGAGLVRWDEGLLRVDRQVLDWIGSGVWASALPGRARSTTLEGPLDELLAWISLAGPSVPPAIVCAAAGLPTWEFEAEVSALEGAGAIRFAPLGGYESMVESDALSRWNDADRARVHLAIADRMLPGAVGRLEHFVAADDCGGVADESLHLASSWIDTGTVGRAQGLLAAALSLVRLHRERPRESELVCALGRAALADGSGPALRAARYEAMQSENGRPVAALIEAWAAAQARIEHASTSEQALPRFDDLQLEAYRRMLPIRAAMARDLAEAEARIVEATADGISNGALASRCMLALGHLRFRQARYAEAVVLYDAVREGADTPLRQASAWINAGNARFELHAFDGAIAAFAKARSIAADLRSSLLEGAAVAGERAAAYALERTTDPDPELVDIVSTLDDPAVLARAALTEAAVAWRAGKLDLGARLADRAAAALEGPAGSAGRLLMRALAAACRRDRAAAAQVLEDARGLRAVEWQVAGFAASIGVRVHSVVLPTSLVNDRSALLAPTEVRQMIVDAGWEEERCRY